MDRKKFTISEKSKEVIRLENFLDYGIDFQSRTISVYDLIDETTTQIINAGLNIMVDQSIDNPITIQINSPGGCPYNSLAIYDLIRSQKETEIITIGYGQIMSGATLIFAAGDTRIAYENCRFMFHNVSVDEVDGKQPHIKIEANEMEYIYKKMCEIYARHTDRDKKYWLRTIKHDDRYYSSEEVKNFKFIDKIIKN
jgi:ATP-dependent Clp protease protease subunit